MIWYLLYPFRGTTEAPDLAPTHPLRRHFARYGNYVARHVVATLLVSVAVATAFLYPIPFLFTTDFTNGASNLPHHAWTGAQPLSHDGTIDSDVIMRSVWVHSGYMQALDKHVLTSALELQDHLLGSTRDFNPRYNDQEPDTTVEHDTALSATQRDKFHAINGLTNSSWFFHSPLLYWGCSQDRIEADSNIIATVNNGKNQSTPANVTLRHSIVFSGKRFEDRRLLAADALVITLIHLRDSPVGRQWERNAALLPEDIVDKWDIYPSDRRSLGSQLFEFQFRPISWQDTVTLALAYALTLFYFLMTLSKLRAVKSKFGLMLTTMAQIIFSIMSSFTLCAIFQIDLSRIPRVAYPLVILSMSLENVLRLINAVILTPSEDSTSSIIGYAFGETAHTAVASCVQNVVILLALSRWVSAGVSAFCIFVAIASIFDCFYLSTFFLSVLSVDVRRTELSDALARASIQNQRQPSELPLRSSWLDDVLRGKSAISTRIAGTVVMLGFIFTAQWHFFQDTTILNFLIRLCQTHKKTDNWPSHKAATLEDIHQARSPTSWLRLQDHETAKEVINIIKPSAHSYVAKVYDPLIFVLKGADRTPGHSEPSLLPAVYDFIHHQFLQFVVVVVMVSAAVRLLTSFLLWEDEVDDGDNGHADDDRLSNKSFMGGHALDIAMLKASPDGHVITVGLDRLIRVWDVQSGNHSYAITDAGKTKGTPFPVLAMTIDGDSRWLAISSSNKVVIWNLTDHTWEHSIPIDLNGQKPEGFYFCKDPEAKNAMPSLFIVRRNGILTDIRIGDAEQEDFSICRSPLACVRPIWGNCSQASLAPSIMTVSRRGCLHIARKEKSSWQSDELQVPGDKNHGVHQVIPLTPLGFVLIARTNSVHVMNADDRRFIHTFDTEQMQPRSLQATFSATQGSRGGHSGLTALTLCYDAIETGDCILQTYTPAENKDFIRIETPAQTMGEKACPWEMVKETRRQIQNPGVWKVVADCAVVGVRRRQRQSRDLTRPDARTRSNGLRHRSPRKDGGRDFVGSWEIWTVSTGTRPVPDETRPLFQDDEKAGHLFVSELGPMIRVGQRSVAFAFGNVMKSVTVGGHERFEASWEEKSRDSLTNISSRRRRIGTMPRPKA